jgi:sensor domain CHASE-containing protein
MVRVFIWSNTEVTFTQIHNSSETMNSARRGEEILKQKSKMRSSALAQRTDESDRHDVRVAQRPLMRSARVASADVARSGQRAW